MSEMVVRAALAAASWGCNSALDIGSGNGKYRALVGRCDSIDGYQEAPCSTRHWVGDLLTVLPSLADKSYDLVYALDVIEHLEKADGFRLLDHMARLSKKRVLVFTPNGFMPQEGPNPWQRHRSGWSAEDFRSRGFWVATTDFNYGAGLTPAAALWAVLS